MTQPTKETNRDQSLLYTTLNQRLSIPVKPSLQEYPKLLIKTDPGVCTPVDTVLGSRVIKKALQIRSKYLEFNPDWSVHVSKWEMPEDPFNAELSEVDSEAELVYHEGVWHVKDKNGKFLTRVVGLEEFRDDYKEMHGYINNGPARSFSYERLDVLRRKFIIHKLLTTRDDDKRTTVCCLFFLLILG